MYYYVYDEFIQDPKFERELSLVETRLTDLGISGKIARLALFRDAKTLIQDEIKKGAKTIVAVGNDLTLTKVIEAVADSGVAVAVIPIGSPNSNRMADILGVPAGVVACDVLSARIIEEIDAGDINGHRFLHSAIIEDAVAPMIVCNGNYKLMPTKRASIEIKNLTLPEPDVRAANPTDGRLEIVIRTQGRSWIGKKKVTVSVVPVELARITSPEIMKITIDGKSIEAREFKIRVIPNQLRVITGKGRKF
ncbi:MAG: diacylglycerol kinase family protein [Candidatus Uhrbacteria bacterium]|nr:diacylglycerol kinase family protein [Candidatus Uhrbacteria bacterium]